MLGRVVALASLLTVCGAATASAQAMIGRPGSGCEPSLDLAHPNGCDVPCAITREQYDELQLRQTYSFVAETMRCTGSRTRQYMGYYYGPATVTVMVFKGAKPGSGAVMEFSRNTLTSFDQEGL